VTEKYYQTQGEKLQHYYEKYYQMQFQLSWSTTKLYKTEAHHGNWNISA
jgi:hypothetical protein